MVQLRTKRSALALYGVLFVLPTVVLGGLQWRQIVQDRDSELAAVPREAEDAARRLRERIEDKLAALVAEEQARPFWEYARFFCPESADVGDAPLIPSPLTRDARPEGLLCWFSTDLQKRDEADLELFWGDAADDRASYEADLRQAAVGLKLRHLKDGPLRRAGRIGDYVRMDLKLRSVAANRADESDQQCLRDQVDLLCENEVEIVFGEFYLQFYQEDDGRPRLVASRRVLVEPLPYLTGLNECLHRLNRGLGLLQGFFIDPTWFFAELPEKEARSVLGESFRYVPAGEEDCCDGRQEYHADIQLIGDLDLETYRVEEAGFAPLRIAVDTADIEKHFRSRSWRFFGVAGMLALSLATGLVLLMRSVSRDLEQARRTENFVAAVTHELRTPLSSIKLHGEMLLDGWAKEPAKQQEYYRRIVRETERLSTMVERVLEKARLAAGNTRPYPGDLNELIDGQAAHVSHYHDDSDGECRDLAFELAEDLPGVMLNQEALTSILVNLVENARKYAPVDTANPAAESILVRTRLDDGVPVLEVLDRGPGIEPEEAARIFQAFYRVGNEATRTSRGTGLGLHLVHLQAEAIGGEVSVLPREGGGSVFRVAFARA